MLAAAANVGVVAFPIIRVSQAARPHREGDSWGL
jgi:hypothetical protein